MAAVEPPAHFRLAARRQVSLAVTFRVGVALTRRGRTFDLSMAGAFVETPHPPLPGEAVVLVLESPTAWDPLEIPCHVRWADEDGARGPMGFGVRFGDLSDTQSVALHELLLRTGFLDASG